MEEELNKLTLMGRTEIKGKKYPIFLERLGLLCLLYTSPSPRDVEESRMPSSA